MALREAVNRRTDPQFCIEDLSSQHLMKNLWVGLFWLEADQKPVATTSGNPPCWVACPQTLGSILQKLGSPFLTHPILALIHNRLSHYCGENSNMKPSCHFPFKRHFFQLGTPTTPFYPLVVIERQRMKKPLSLLKYSHWYRSQSRSWHLDSTIPGTASPRAFLNSHSTSMPGRLLQKALLSSFILSSYSVFPFIS